MDGSHRVFVHVSDIHFHHRWNGNNLDRDTELRLGVIREAVKIVKELGRCDGIFVTGDVAHSGHPDQYTLAKGWLSELTEALECRPEQVWCVPGNHDVERSASAGTRETLISHLRSCDDSKIGSLLVACLSDPASEAVWFGCFENYCDFARRFNCQIIAKQPWWIDSSLRLNDGSSLIIRGVTSALISNGHDHRETAKLVLGDIQLQHEKGPECVHLLLCHHPPDWLRDSEEVEEALKAYAHVQLYGHKHKQAFRMVDDRVRIHAGAIQPPREEPDWHPRFNVMELRVRRTPEGKRFLDVVAHVRQWDASEREFKPDVPADGRDAYKGSVPLPDWDPTVEPPKNPCMPDAPEQPVKTSVGETSGGRLEANPHKLLTYRFFELSYTVRLQIAQELDLIDESDEHLTERERMRQVFGRARAKKKLGALWQTVRQRTGASDMQGEPFAGQ
jgi:predicted phosphodiesterase